MSEPGMTEQASPAQDGDGGPGGAPQKAPLAGYWAILLAAVCGGGV